MSDEDKTNETVFKEKAFWFFLIIIFIIFVIMAAQVSGGFFNFVFNSMFSDKIGEGNSFWSAVVIPIVSGCIAVWGLYLLNKRTKAADDQAESARKQHRLETQKVGKEKFENSMKLLAKDGSPTMWYYALKTIENMAVTEPDEWFSDGLQILLVAGKEISTKTRMVESKNFKDISDANKDANQFIFHILATIIRILNNPNSEKFRPKTSQNKDIIKITGFCIPFYELDLQNKQGSYRANIIENVSLNHFLFENCNLAGVQIRDCDLIKCEFLNTHNVEIERSLISHGPTTDKTSWEAHAESFNINFRMCYVWDDDTTSVKLIQQRFIHFSELDSGLYKTIWNNMKFPKIPEPGYFLWEKNTPTPENVVGITVEAE
ncbi:MAG: hypothetical protein HRU29_00620 [Rhizobiales bacterium]|nr:hypothetical protein [Hyphomicrobiales bacterium]NRB12877.1 hypothetical protein [Hyphomicrobiales bacterium]